MSPRTGRPKADNPKDIVIRCRISKELNERIERYCSEHRVTKTEVMIKGIESVIKNKRDCSHRQMSQSLSSASVRSDFGKSDYTIVLYGKQ